MTKQCNIRFLVVFFDSICVYRYVGYVNKKKYTTCLGNKYFRDGNIKYRKSITGWFVAYAFELGLQRNPMYKKTPTRFAHTDFSIYADTNLFGIILTSYRCFFLRAYTMQQFTDNYEVRLNTIYSQAWIYYTWTDEECA